MKRKLIVVFLILTIVPAGLLSWAGIMSIREEKERAAAQFAILAGERLDKINLKIESVFSDIAGELLRIPKETFGDVDSIREYTRGSKYIRQIFIIDEEGTIIYPSEAVPLSNRERDFLTRTMEIGLSPGLFLGPSEELSEGGGAAKTSREYGWYTWYLGEGINFILWRQTEEGYPRDDGSIENNTHFEKGASSGGSSTGLPSAGILGIELNRMAVISDIINALPDTQPEQTQSENGGTPFRIVLWDITGTVVYQWGGYPPGEIEKAVAVVPVAEPLDAWRLSFYAPPDAAASGRGRMLPVIASIIFVMAAVIGLAVYLYRESTREVRDALEKVSFVNQVSHELKTPLTNIRMYAELLEDRIPEDDEKTERYVDVLVSESRRLSRLIGNVLTFAKQQKSGLQLNPSEAVPDDTIRSVVETFRPSLESKNVTIDLDLHAEKPVVIDTDIAEQIVSNLISNVEKYAASGRYLGIESYTEEVQLSGTKTTDHTTDASHRGPLDDAVGTPKKGSNASRRSNTPLSPMVTIIVRDKGPGIPHSQRERVFKPFYRLSNKLTDGVSGTGIGLAIVRTLAALHGGEAKVLPSDEGTVFQVTMAGLQRDCK